MSSAPRPLLLGYIRADLLTTATEIAQAESTLEAFAEQEQFALGTVYIDHDSTTPGAFSALVDEVRSNEDAWGVVVPDLRHLAGDEHHIMRRHHEHFASMLILVATAFSP
jgi:DNA invertase Pin-like site-specific DNA recombinase